MTDVEQLFAWSAAEQLFRWSGTELLAVPPVDDRLLVADSWLVVDGCARGLASHRTRFTAACLEATGARAGTGAGTAIGVAAEGSPTLAELDGFWAAVLAALPHRGEWFPRVELTDVPHPSLRLRLRPAPPRQAEVRVWVPPEPDPRCLPRHKGPDLAILADLRARAMAVGGGEALLRDADGHVVEAAHSSVLWWEGKTLFLPDPAQPTLPGVTAALITRRARDLGVPVAHGRRRLTDLEGRETWLTNALHGIRPVVGWLGAAVTPGPAERAETWQEWLVGSVDTEQTRGPRSALSQIKGLSRGARGGS